MSDSTSLERNSTNNETRKHIEVVSRLLASVQIELMRRQFTHDQSKLRDPELETFVKFIPRLRDSTYGSEEYKGFLKSMKPALDHHYSHNRHHPEYFSEGISGMSLFDLLEMLIDWVAAVKRHSDGDINQILEINTDRFSIDPQLKQILKNTIPWIQDEFEGLMTQKDLKPKKEEG